jgi:hypothetical protein
MSLPPEPPAAPPVPPTSRYFPVGTAIIVMPNGDEIVYLRRRFIPPPDRFQLLQLYTVVEGDRHDTLAARLIGDPEQSWRLADPNVVLRAEELTDTPGRRIRVTMPEGVVVSTDA